MTGWAPEPDDASGPPDLAGLEVESVGDGHVMWRGHRLVRLSGCDYLGFAEEPRVLDAAVAAIRRCGLSTGASRTTSGNTSEHAALEAELLALLGPLTGVEDLVLLPDGYTANLAAAEAVAGWADGVMLDARAHPSLGHAFSLGGMGGVVRYAHREAGVVARTIATRGWRRPVVATDGVFAVTGAVAPVGALLGALPPGGLLVVDDCHGFGVLGDHGAGTVERAGVRDGRVVITGTLAKAIGGAGGFVAGRADVVRRARCSRAYVCTTPASPGGVAGARCAVGLMRSEPGRLASLRAGAALLASAVSGAVAEPPESGIPIATVTGDERALAALEASLAAAGLYAPATRYPGGPSGASVRLIARATMPGGVYERVRRVVDGWRRSHIEGR